jgi:hypothetical protein
MTEIISWEAIKHAVPPRFEAMHRYLDVIDYGREDGLFELTYSIPYRSELGMEGFTYDYDEVEQFFKLVEVQNHWITDRESKEYWEHEQKLTMFANPYKRIESQTVTVVLKKKIKL